MDIKRIAIGTIVGSIAFYFVSYVIFDFALASYYVANVGTATGALRTANIQWVFWIGNVAAALMIMLAFELKGGVISIANGFVIGAIIGLLVLIFRKQSRALIILSIVPVYFFTVQSVVHTEYRYVLAVDYFLFAFAGVAVSYAGSFVVTKIMPFHSGRGLPTSLG